MVQKIGAIPFLAQIRSRFSADLCWVEILKICFKGFRHTKIIFFKILDKMESDGRNGKVNPLTILKIFELVKITSKLKDLSF